MKAKTIKNNRDYDAIAKRIEELVNAEPQTPGAYELKKHICAIISYERNNGFNNNIR
jgi:hypothetical protein